MRFSRRRMLALAGTTVALTSAKAQQPPAPPADRLATARDDNRKSAEKLAQFQIPMSTEPSFVFKA